MNLEFMYTRSILLFRQCCWWNRNFHLFCKSDCKWQTHNCQMFKKRKVLKQCGRKVVCRKVDTWIRRLQEDDSSGELGRKTRTWLDRENRKVILGILCVDVCLLRLRETKGNYAGHCSQIQPKIFSSWSKVCNVMDDQESHQIPFMGVTWSQLYLT